MNPLITPQPLPISNISKSAHDLVIADMIDRKEFGHNKYGVYLQSDNGRNNLIDAYQEILDLAVYVRCQIEENHIEPTELW